ncbi:UDP-N-acetylmuramoyl-tripeptide--D-alanyl-D-alanine ligase [Luteipulveratus halotolerans]|uniref:UDP-N-acetylmuramoyl-tripeptide--D-alanyl-D-alanine ligase n=1 Tax=Luteipulveratus halotolerans TaxID=1631356 RepID=A0A0L6CGG2_9MICO|nr:UDP-N-acetylmuramoyl-tripeptide--D-alanyl-D-alanine ligase [Luteipulveratus halotolerans]KNX36887.1 UDP-N-acetylmuramoyl-tripeptide--D-alanyl-D-alanine ligase [Luteipulveratus halotolerans]
MIPLRLSEIVAITGGEQHGHDVLVEGAVVTDSRECGPGSLYVARVGEHADGHDFVPGARAAGAVAVLGTRVVDDGPTVVVADVQEAFAALARGVVDRSPDLTVIGITGSSGKTSTKDLLAAVLRPVAETVAPVGSYNSEVGVPLTVCRVTPTTRFLVAEMGADGEGHIAYLTRIAPPQIGVVLNVGRAHLGEFGSVEAIARTKSEMVQALAPDGLAVLNADDPTVLAMRDKTLAPVVTVGRSADADVRATDVQVDDLGRASFVVVTPDGRAEVRLRLLGEHHIGNALSVVAAARHLGVSLADIGAALSTAEAASRWRMEMHDLPDGATLVNDAYNANPDSMAAALRALARMGAGGRRTVAVLGTMRELGDDAEAEHQAVGALAVECGIDRLVVVGPDAQGIVTGARAAGATDAATVSVPDVDAAYDLLRSDRRSGDVILLKSSRDSGLRFLGDRVVADVESTHTEGAR